MTINQKLRGWLREQPLFLALTGRNPLKGADKERTLTLIVVPILAFAVVVTGGVGAGFAAVSKPKPTQPVLSQASEVPEQSSSETPAPEEFAAEEPAAIDSYEGALAAWGEPDLAAILTESFPGAQWTLSGNTYAGLNWIGPGTKPTEAELRRLWITVGKLLADRRVAAEEERAQEQAEREAAAEVRAADPSRQELCRSIDYKALYGPGVDYTKILSVHYPGAQWSLNGSAYSGLTWISPGTKPAKATLDALWDDVAFQMCLQKPMSELQARAGTSETEEYVDGVARPKGYSDGTAAITLQNCNQLPQLPTDTFTGGSAQVPQGEAFVPPAGYGAVKSGSGWGSNTGDYDVYTYGLELSQGLSTTGVDLSRLGCLIAEAHGYWDNKYSIGLSMSGDKLLHVLNTQVDRGVLNSVLASIGIQILANPAPEPTPEPEPEPDPEPDADTDTDTDTESE